MANLGDTPRNGLVGPAGAEGHAGAPGPAGVDGQVGATGQTGATGPTGVTGQTGATGQTGVAGRAGGTGPEGPPGGAIHLSRALTDLISESQALRRDVSANERARLVAAKASRRVNQVNTVVVALLLLFVALILTVTWQNNQLGRQVKQGNERIADCTTAGGACYEQSAARTGAAVADIVRASVYVAECSRLYPNESGPDYDAKLERCVAAKLAAARARPSASPTPSVSPSG